MGNNLTSIDASNGFFPGDCLAVKCFHGAKPYVDQWRNHRFYSHYQLFAGTMDGSRGSQFPIATYVDTTRIN